VAVPGETDALRERFGAKSRKDHGAWNRLTRRVFRDRAAWYRFDARNCRVVVDRKCRLQLPTLVSTLQGNLYELKQFSG